MKGQPWKQVLKALAFVACVNVSLTCRAQFSSLDLFFNPGVVGAYNPMLGGYGPAEVMAMVAQPGGKIVVSGSFATLAGFPSQSIGRLNFNGTIDFTSTADFNVRCLLIQADGKIVVGSPVSHLAGQSCTNLGRLNADGSFDATFNPQVNGYVDYIAAQPDGKFLIGGDLQSFTSVAGQPVNRLARLTSNGTLDAQFNPAHGGLIAQIRCLAVQSDGKILVGGEPAVTHTPICTNLIRLNADGSLDSGFQPVVTGDQSFPSVNCLAIQADGKILVGGWFSSLCGQVRANIGRINSDGTLDTNFNASADGSVQVLAVQTDGKILLGGYFSGFIARLNPQYGDVDYQFYPLVTFTPPNTTLYFDPNVDSIAVQPDGQILFGGVFTAVNGQPRKCIARMTATGAVTNYLTFDGSTLTWVRGGCGPEVTSVHFDQFANGAWSDLGDGVRIAGGWQLTNVALQPNGTIRARGRVAVQSYTGSSDSFDEGTMTPITLGISLSQGLPVLSLSGELGKQYTISVATQPGSSNTWSPIATLLLTNNPQMFTDSSAPGQTQRFYRASLGP